MTEKRRIKFIKDFCLKIIFECGVSISSCKASDQVGGYQQASFINNAFNADVVCCSSDDRNSPSDEEDNEDTGSDFE